MGALVEAAGVTAMSAAGPRTKIAILGGGVGAMTAAFALTDQDGWQDKYDITVYQLGWRLGGKGASGRNREKAERIEEHGLHIWFGFYENAFWMMRKAYQLCADLGLTPGSPFSTWRDAFKEHSLLTAMEPVAGKWKPWSFEYLTNDELPGEGGLFLKPWDYVKMLLKWLLDQHHEATHPAVPKSSGTVPALVHSLAGWVKVAWTEVGSFVETTTVVASATVTETIDVLLYKANVLSQTLPDDPRAHQAVHHQAILALLDTYKERFFASVKDSLDKDDELRHHWILLDLTVAMVRGIICDGVLYRGFDCIDQYDAMEWLKRHGCENADSCLVRGMYDLVFAYEKGDVKRPNFAAGTALRATLRILFTYKGAILWKMQAGMGDTIFTPLYKLLEHRGVKFKFFHRVQNLGLSADRSAIDTIDIDIQATVKPEVIKKQGGYQPLVSVKNLLCWPSTPLYDQLEQGEQLKGDGTDLESAWCPTSVDKITLKRGQDFDQVVLGISIGAFRYICPKLIEASTAWANMVAQIQTVQTQAFQMWLTRDAAGLGWVAKERAVVGAYVEPLDTWADMSQVLDKEDWLPADNVQNVSYFCGVLDEGVIPPFTDCKFPAQEAARVKKQALDFLQNNAQPLWPRATDPQNPKGLDWSLLVDRAAQVGAARFDWQHWRANIDPTERYALSLAGTTQYRLPADKSGFSNLVLAGDWTYNGINLGCVEAAAISGLQAARALCGYPKVIVGERDILL
jgi:uncharacterized protein with NAD-binding domain and iron-sulfur cluster